MIDYGWFEVDDDDGDDDDNGGDDYAGVPRRLVLFDGSPYFLRSDYHTLGLMSWSIYWLWLSLLLMLLEVFASVSRLAWAVGKRLGAILGCPGAILGRLGSILEPS